MEQIKDAINQIINSVSTNFGQVQGYMVDQFLNNDFFIGIAIPAIFTGLLYAFRGSIYSFWAWLKRVLSSDLTINTDSREHYHDLAEFVYSKCLIKFFQRSFVIKSEFSNEIGTGSYQKDVAIGIGYGRSIGMYKGYPMLIFRDIEESDSDRFKETIKITFVGSRRRAANMFVEDFKEFSKNKAKEDRVTFLKSCKYGDWEVMSKKPKRPLNTVILPEHDVEYLKDKIQKFFESEAEYLRRGIPWNLGILLYGPPGTGKSSLIHALASEYEKKIYYMKGADFDIGQEVTDGLLILEDIDAANFKSNRDDDTLTTSSFSDVLNSLDGPLTPHGLVTIATTNHIEKLDPALIRHGRFDVKLELGYMKWPEWVKFCKLMDRKSPVTEEEFVDVNPSKARYMLTYYDDSTIIDEFKNTRNE